MQLQGLTKFVVQLNAKYINCVSTLSDLKIILFPNRSTAVHVCDDPFDQLKSEIGFGNLYMILNYRIMNQRKIFFLEIQNICFKECK